MKKVLQNFQVVLFESMNIVSIEHLNIIYCLSDWTIIFKHSLNPFSSGVYSLLDDVELYHIKSVFKDLKEKC